MPNIIKTRKEYDALTNHLNYSGAKMLLVSPAHYKNYLTQPREETKALRVGSLTHAKVLQPEIVDETFIVSPELDKRTKEGKLLFEQFLAKAGTKTVMTQEEWQLTEDVANTMKQIIQRMGVTFLKTEFMFTAELSNCPVKVAIDALGDDDYLYDLKTCESASPRDFLRSVIQYRYALQAYFYRSAFEGAFGSRLKGFRFIAVEKEAPFAGAVYELGAEVMTSASFDFEKAIKLYKSCTELDAWPSYPEEVQVIDIPSKSATSTPINFA
jgi:exodeoxyribonuclease VIII